MILRLEDRLKVILYVIFIITTIAVVYYRESGDESNADRVNTRRRLPLVNQQLWQCKQHESQDIERIDRAFLNKFHRFTTLDKKNTTSSASIPLPKLFHEEETLSAPRGMVLHPEYDIKFVGETKVERSIEEDPTVFNNAVQRFCSMLHQPYVNATSTDIQGDAVMIITSISIEYSAGSIQSDLFSDVNRVYSKDHEAYQLIIHENGNVNIVANGEQGVKHALSTLSQVLYSMVAYHFPVEIVDWPENHWRGVMIDVSRHFQPLKLLKRCIDAMVASKLNILHLHLTDSQSFPLLLNDRPDGLPVSKLGYAGSFSSEKIYTVADLKELVAYGKLNGIEIIPEVDFPAHSLSWGKAFPEIMVHCPTVAKKQETPHNVFLLNPANPKTIPLIEEILTQLSDIFPSPYLHIGGDEVYHECWAEDTEVMQWAKEQYLTQYNITTYFESQILQIVKRVGKIPIVWQGVFDASNVPTRQNTGVHTRKLSVNDDPSTNNGSSTNIAYHGRRLSDAIQEEKKQKGFNYTSILYRLPTTSFPSSSNDTIIIEPWKCWGGLALRTSKTAYQQQYPVYMSACWYLDFNSDWTTFLATNILDQMINSIQDDEARNLAKTTTRNAAMSIDINGLPDTSSATTTAAKVQPQQHQNYFTLGGEGAMWTERVDHTNLECRMWPRMGAIAYRLWGLGNHLCLLSDNTTSSTVYHNSNNATAIQTIIQTCIPPTRSAFVAQEIVLSAIATKVLYASYVNYRYYLHDILHIGSAEMSFHYPEVEGMNSLLDHATSTTKQRKTHVSSSTNSVTRKTVTTGKDAVTFRPVFIRSRQEAFRLINEITIGLTLTSKGIADSKTMQLFKSSSSRVTAAADMISSTTFAPPQPPNIFWMTSQCFGIPEAIQRPLTQTQLKVHQFNIADGSVGLRGDYMLQWLQRKANEGVMLIGFCELVHWQHLVSKQEMVKNVPILRLRAANAGYVYSHMTTPTPTSSYPLGLVSIYPFQIIKEYEAPHFQRAVLHVYFPKLQYHVFIVHLHAHSSTKRVQEVQYLVKELTPLLQQHAKILIMGDFNTLSPLDHIQHEEDHIVAKLSRSSTRHPEIISRWKRKYLTTTTDAIDYRPMQELLTAGFVDSCVESCCLQQTNGTCSRHWSMSMNDSFSVCMKTYCAGSEPTKFNPEWPEDMDILHPTIRLDFILMSPAVLQSTQPIHKKHGGMGYVIASNNETNNGSQLFGGVEVNNYTDIMSDHYPVYAQWKDYSLPCRIELY